MKPKQRDLLLVLLEFSDQSDAKPRPVIVVSNDNYNNKFLDFLAVPLTTVLTPREHTISITNSELESGTIRAPSLAKVDKMASIEQTIIFKKIGVIRKDVYERIKKELLVVIS